MIKRKLNSNWTVDSYRGHHGYDRVFRTRAEARRFCKQEGIPMRAIVRTHEPVTEK